MLARFLWYLLTLARDQWKARQELERIQLARLRKIIHHAYDTVPLYRRLFDENSVRPGDVHTIGDLRKIPMISRNDLKNHRDSEITSNKVKLDSCIRRRTSGSTGEPLTVFLDGPDFDFWAALEARKMLAYSCRPWDSTVYIGAARPSETFRILGKRFNLRRLSMSDDLEGNLQAIRSFKPQVIKSSPSYLKFLAESVVQGKITEIHPKLIHTEGEHLDERTRGILACAFRSEVMAEYGAAEVGDLAWECPTLTGYHINTDAQVVEFVKDAEPVAPGESGEVVVSCLYRRAMPIIRYRLGDVASYLDDDCACGRGLQLLAQIQGRLVDSITLRDGKHIAPFVLMNPLDNMHGISRYQVVQEDLNLIRISLQVQQNFDSLRTSILNHFRGLLPEEVQVVVERVDRIDVPSGKKFRPVLSKIFAGEES